MWINSSAFSGKIQALKCKKIQLKNLIISLPCESRNRKTHDVVTWYFLLPTACRLGPFFFWWNLKHERLVNDVRREVISDGLCGWKTKTFWCERRPTTHAGHAEQLRWCNEGENIWRKRGKNLSLSYVQREVDLWNLHKLNRSQILSINTCSPS